MNSLTNMEAAEKILYLEALGYNENYENRVIKTLLSKFTVNRLEGGMSAK